MPATAAQIQVSKLRVQAAIALKTVTGTQLSQEYVARSLQVTGKSLTNDTVTFMCRPLMKTISVGAGDPVITNLT